MAECWMADLAEGYRFEKASFYNIRLAALILLGRTLYKYIHTHTFLCISNIRSIEESTNRKIEREREKIIDEKKEKGENRINKFKNEEDISSALKHSL